MPTYEYRCKSCGRDFEAVQSFTDSPLTKCEVCGGKLRKVFGNIGVTFKGSGFYRTDSRASSSASKSRDGKKADTKTESSKSESGDSSGSKSETKASSSEAKSA